MRTDPMVEATREGVGSGPVHKQTQHDKRRQESLSHALTREEGL